MGSKRERQAYKRKDIEYIVEGDPESNRVGRDRSVYFTDQSPTFTLYVKNNRDGQKIATSVHAELIHETKGVRKAVKNEFALAPGECKALSLNSDMLGYQGNWVIRLKPVFTSDGDIRRPQTADDEVWVLGPENQPIVYTFSAWNREFYKANYLYPRRAQYVSAGLAILIVLVGVFQALLALLIVLISVLQIL